AYQRDRCRDFGARQGDQRSAGPGRCLAGTYCSLGGVTRGELKLSDCLVVVSRRDTGADCRVVALDAQVADTVAQPVACTAGGLGIDAADGGAGSRSPGTGVAGDPVRGFPA